MKYTASLAYLFIVTLFFSVVPSGLFHVNPQKVIATKNLTHIGCINYNNNTVTVSCNANLSSIYKVVNDTKVLEKGPHGEWILKASIKVNPVAKLTIDHTDTSWLKITNKNKNEPNYISIFGNAIINGVKITSWDPVSNDIIREDVNGSIPRPYIIVDKGAGSVNVSNSELAFLGYSSYPSNGFLYRNGGAGSSIINNTFHDMYDGFYSYDAKLITIKDNKYYNNLRYGIDPHTGSHDLSIIGNVVYNNGLIGIICSLNCYNILLDKNIVHDNGMAGMMFSLNTSNSTARNNYAYNEKVAISLNNSSNSKVYNNLFKSSHTGVFMLANNSDNHIYNNTIANVSNGLVIAKISNKNNLFENNNLQNVSDVTNVNGINNNSARHNVIYNAGPSDIIRPSTHLQTITYGKRIALVEPTFTFAAYRNGSFYNFYQKHTSTALAAAKKQLPYGQNNSITTDLNLLKNRPIPHGPFLYYAHPTTWPSIPYLDYFKLVLQHVKKYSPFVTNITDVDVHQGKIFHADGRNAYDVLFLFHNEYATASEYNNLRQFVSNGGTIVFAFSNLLTVEVSYNRANDSITLVKGHHWKFDGRSAEISIAERWLDENRNWTGSNFLDIPNSKGVYFRNNPFNYTHHEEQYVTNPHAIILLDYRASYPSQKDFNATVATYQMNYGKGKVIGLGIWGEGLIKSKAFFDYFDNVIIPIALAPSHKNNSIMN